MNDFFTNRSCHTNHLFRKILKQIIFIAFLFLFSMCIQDDPEEVFSLKPGDSLPGFSVQDNKGGLISNTKRQNKCHCFCEYRLSGLPEGTAGNRKSLSTIS